MIVFGLALMFGAADEPAVRRDRLERPQSCLMVVVITGAAIALYQTLGFIVTMSLLVFMLLVVVERKPCYYAAAYSIGLTRASPGGCSARRSSRRSKTGHSGF